MRKLWIVCAGLVLFFAGSAAADSHTQSSQCPGGRSKTSAMWFSILHPGLGEWYLQDWGPWRNLPPKKFWLGFIPIYGWPGYLQVRSAREARRCITSDI